MRSSEKSPGTSPAKTLIPARSYNSLMSFRHTMAATLLAVLLCTLPVQALSHAGGISTGLTPRDTRPAMTGGNFAILSPPSAGYTGPPVSIPGNGCVTVSHTSYGNSGQATGTIQVYVNPGGGDVCLDDTLCHLNVGLATYTGSTQFPEVSAGNHIISVNNTGGFLPITVPVTVNASEMSTLTIGLPPVNIPSGSIQVVSTPSGATACIDNGNCQQTPATFGSQNSGTYHTVTVSLPGYEPFRDNAYVVVGETTMITASLTPVSPPTGTVLVSVSPATGTVCIDNASCQEISAGSPGNGTAEFTGIPAGTVHTISVAADGYEPYSAKETVPPDQITLVTVTLQPLLAVTVIPSPESTTVPSSPLPVPTKSGSGTVPALAALAFCGVIFLYRKSEK